jgi:predicted ATPase
MMGRLMAPLFGREADLTNVRALFEHGERLVTVTGAPGIGKTRMAEALASIEPSIRVDLGEARSAADVVALVGGALGVTATGDRELDALRVTKALASREEDLVVLDTFEHLTAFANVTVQRWLEASSTGRFLVTSREGLRLPEEWIYELAPLDESFAIMLLVDSARRAGWTASPGSAPVLGKIAQRLDGIPLALELAAHRIAALGEQVVADRLSEHLELLSASPPHSRTLREAIAWSWGLLDGSEKSALAQLSVFSGDLGLEAAEAVVRVPDARTIDLVQSLREKSLLAPTTDGGRFRLLASIREFAREHLGEEETFARYAGYYLSLAEGLALGERKSNARASLRVLERERENLQAILEGSRSLEQKTRAVFALAPLAMARGPIEPLLGAVDEILAAGGEGPELLALRARALRRVGRLDESEAALEAVLAATDPASPRVPLILHEIAWTKFSSGRIKEAIKGWERARDARRLRPPIDETAEGVDLVRMALALRELGEHDRASVLAAQALSIGRRSHDAGEEAMATGMLAVLASDRGAFERAFDLAQRAVERCGAEGSAFFEGYALGSLAITHQAAGNLDEAEKIARGVHRALAAIGNVRLDAIAFVHLGWIAWERGALRDAWNHFDDARTGFEALRDARNVALAVGCLAAVEAQEGERAAANGRRAVLTDGTPLTRVLDLLRIHVEESDPHRARERLDAMGAPISYEERIVRRILLAALDKERAPEAARRAFVALSGDDVTCAVAGAPIPLARRASARRVLCTLVRERIARPGSPVAWNALAESAWPGELLAPAVGKNRVKVTVAWLRKLGLRDAIESDARGYWLGDGCDVTVA